MSWCVYNRSTHRRLRSECYATKAAARRACGRLNRRARTRGRYIVARA